MLSIILLFLIIVSFGLFAVKYYVPKKRRRLLELGALVPTYKGCLPIIGHAYKLIGGSEQFWQNIQTLSKATEDAGGVLAVRVGPSLQVFVNDPDDALTVLNTCLEKSYFYKMGSSWVGEGLITADVPTWKRNRKLLNPTFSQHVLDGFLVIFNEQSALLAQDLEPLAGAGMFDPREYFTERTLETVCQTAVGISLDDKSVIDQKYKKAVETAFDVLALRLASFWLHPDFLYGLTSTKKLEDEAMATLQNMSRSVLYKRKAERQQAKLANTSSRRFIAFLDLLLDMAEDGLFTDEQILEELNTMIAAGHDTSARALSTILVLVGTYPEVQEKMYEEVMSVLGSSTDLDKEDITKLVYTEAVIKEALRISPVTPIIARDVEKEVKLKNYTLPAGSGCVVSLWGIHRLPIWGPDRFEFCPERWLDPASLPQSPGAYCAFSIGRRNCIGKTYALMALKTMLVHLIRKFRVTADYSKVKRKFDLLLKFVAGHEIALELRK
ncbi:cytochrome P450 4c3-like [Choristoneura fumiferana]|uniref:cytochrome P450 4c3-like n=1 Tax=Choristoneura fumiferana TaxID=7141 RepID=UPI003D158E1B